MNLPIVTIEVQHMKQMVHHAFHEMQLQMDEHFKQAMDAACDPARLQFLVNNVVQKELDAAIEKEVKEFFSYGEGRSIIKEAVIQRLQQDETSTV